MTPTEAGPAFDAVAGHRHPKSFLERIQETGRIATGLLFHGDEGRGKAMVARAFLQRLFCAEALGCGRCPPCRRFLAGSHPDLVTVACETGKSRIAIAQVRELGEWFSKAPFEADRRAAVIDDAHLMTTEAQNALLKLLEEPPGAGLLILVTAEPGGLLETIHSRLQSLYFGPLSDEDMMTVLRRESDVPEADCRAVLLLAQGSPGRALRDLGDEHGRAVLESARRLFDLETQPFAYAEFVCGGKTAGAAARSEVAAVLAVAAELMSRRIVVGVRGGGAATGLLEGPHDPGLESLEEIQRLILEAAGSVAGNTSPRGVLEALKIRLHRELGRARRRTVGGGS